MIKAIGGLAVFALILTAPALILTGCGSSGGSPSSNDSSSGGDSSSSGGSDSSEPNTGGSSSESGANRSSHNAGRDCVACHATLEGSKRYVYAGTVYASAAGTATSPGVVVEITESSGTKIHITTDRNGNFYTTRGTRGGTYNVTIVGNKVGMISSASNGGCSSCHGAAFPVIFVN